MKAFTKPCDTSPHNFGWPGLQSIRKANKIKLHFLSLPWSCGGKRAKPIESIWTDKMPHICIIFCMPT